MYLDWRAYKHLPRYLKHNVLKVFNYKIKKRSRSNLVILGLWAVESLEPVMAKDIQFYRIAMCVAMQASKKILKSLTRKKTVTTMLCSQRQQAEARFKKKRCIFKQFSCLMLFTYTVPLISDMAVMGEAKSSVTGVGMGKSTWPYASSTISRFDQIKDVYRDISSWSNHHLCDNSPQNKRIF